MIEEFIRYWWLPTLRGAALIALGMLTLFLANNMSLPLTEILSRVSLVLLFALYLGVSGLLTIITAALVRHVSHRWVYLGHGVLLAALCLTILLQPAVRLETIVLLTIAHAVVNALAEGRIALALKHHKKEASALGIIAAISVGAAIALMLLRNGPVGDMTMALGLYALAYGLCLVYFGWHLHRQSLHLS